MRSPLPLVAALALACAHDVHVADPDDVPSDTDLTVDSPDDTGDTAAPVDTPTPTEGCRATPAAATRTRGVVVSFPYTSDGERAYGWEVLTLSEAGELARPGTSFTMGRAPWGEVVFSPDGTLGVVPQEDGTLGIFTLDGLRPTVVEAAWNGDDAFYAGAVTFDPSGDRAWIVDGNWPENGGGIYEVTFDCETGAPTLVGQVIATKLAVGLHLLDDGRAVVVATQAADEDPADVFVLDGWPDAPVVTGSETLFTHDAIVASYAVTADQKYVLVGDNSQFSGVPNRIAVAALDAAGPTKAGEIELDDPFAIVASPYDDAALVASGFGDALLALSRDDGAATPFSSTGQLDYVGAHPALPATMVRVPRGPLRGLVLVSENTGVRRARFDHAGGVEDLGLFSFGDGVEDIPGAIGVQP